MSPMVPDCGVLTTPRRSPPIKLNGGARLTFPKLASLPYKTPPPSTELAGVTLSTGFSFGFYKSPKLPVTPVRKVEHQPVVQRGSKHRRDTINKGVSHKIKKPKPKSKEQKKKTRTVKTVMKRLKAGNFTPCPWIPSNRSPLKKVKSDGKKKRHVLASPGMSLLEDDTSQDEEEAGTNKKFFTSRSRASATVNIGRNVLLAAKKGDISLKQKEGLFAKKNVGRVVEEELDQFITSSNSSQSLPTPSPLPSVKANPRPMPTRVITTPSPPKRTQSPKKAKKLFNPTQLIMSDNPSESLQDMEAALKDMKSGKQAATAIHATDKRVENGVSVRRSPRKLDGLSTPVKRSPSKQDRFSSPVRKSPRKCTSPSRTPNRLSSARTLTPSKKTTPAKKFSAELKLTESDPSPNEMSPEDGTTVVASQTTAAAVNGASPSVGLATSPKLYPLFDRQQWRSDESSSPKTEKSCHKNHAIPKCSSSQMVIDAGQKEYGVKQCADCGIVYEIANQEDEASHKFHHDSITNLLKFAGWKKENMVRNLDEFGGRVVMVTVKDPPYCWRKVNEVLKVVDAELGFAENGVLVQENTRAFLYVLDRKVVGCLIAERISKANRVIPSKSVSNNASRLLCCSQDQFKVWAGVSRLWVLESHRGKGIAFKLTDAMKCNMFSHYILLKDDIAFSDPTESGSRFAEKFSERRDFLVYRR